MDVLWLNRALFPGEGGVWKTASAEICNRRLLQPHAPAGDVASWEVRCGVENSA